MSVEYQCSLDECDLAAQTQVSLEKIRYIWDLGPHIQAAWVWVSNNHICIVQNVMKRSDMGRAKRAKKGLQTSSRWNRKCGKWFSISGAWTQIDIHC